MRSYREGHIGRCISSLVEDPADVTPILDAYEGLILALYEQTAVVVAKVEKAKKSRAAMDRLGELIDEDLEEIRREFGALRAGWEGRRYQDGQQQ